MQTTGWCLLTIWCQFRGSWFFSAAKGCRKVLYTGYARWPVVCTGQRPEAAYTFFRWILMAEWFSEKNSFKKCLSSFSTTKPIQTVLIRLSVSFFSHHFLTGSFFSGSLTCFFVSFESIGPKNSLVTSAFSVGSNVIIFVNVHGRIHLQRGLLGHQEKSNLREPVFWPIEWDYTNQFYMMNLKDIITHMFHETGIFTYMNGSNVW